MAGLWVGQAFGVLLLPGFGVSSSSPQVPSLRAGSLVPRTGEARKSVGKARKSEPARELLIFEFRPSRDVKSAFHMCQII